MSYVNIGATVSRATAKSSSSAKSAPITRLDAAAQKLNQAAKAKTSVTRPSASPNKADSARSAAIDAISDQITAKKAVVDAKANADATKGTSSGLPAADAFNQAKGKSDKIDQIAKDAVEKAKEVGAEVDDLEDIANETADAVKSNAPYYVGGALLVIGLGWLVFRKKK